MVFLKSEERCGFHPENLSSSIRKDHSIEKESCLIFMNSVLNFSAKSKVAKAETNYFAFGAKYNFAIKASPCTNQLQDVEMVLFCEGPTVLNGSTCGQGCNRLSEVCRRSSDVNEEFCIPERRIDDFCDGNLPCPRNSECRMVNYSTSCQCLKGYETFDGKCVKVGLTVGETCNDDSQCSGTNNASLCLHDWIQNKKVCSCVNGYIASVSNCILGGLALNAECKEDQQCTGTINGRTCFYDDGQNASFCQCDKGYIERNSSCFKKDRHLYESCDWSEQCTGSTGATECKAVYGMKICYCSQDKRIFEGSCLQVGLTLGENCYVNGQCTGTSNSVCESNPDQFERLTCQCSTGFMRHNESCLKEYKRLNEECEIDSQCNRTFEEVVCKEIHHRKMCVCNLGYMFMEENSFSKCLKVGLKLNESCYVAAQCTGTPNSGVCMADSNDISNLTCRCSTGYIRYKERCLKEYKQLYDECEIDVQCYGTSEESICKEIYHRKMCMCNKGYKYMEVKGNWKCMKVGLTLGEPCYVNKQCTGTPNAVICMSEENDAGNLTCSCNSTREFMRYNETCLQVNRQLYEKCEIDDQCNGTSGKVVCREIQGRKLCLCKDGFIEDNTALKCLQARMVNEQAWIADKRIKLLVIVVGGIIIITCFVCLLIVVLFALKKRKSDKQRFECQYSSHTCIEIGDFHNPSTDDTRNVDDQDVSRAYDHNSIYDHTNGILNVIHQREGQEHENVYSHIETQYSFAEQHSDHYTYSYNHLHQKPFPISLVYSGPKATSV